MACLRVSQTVRSWDSLMRLKKGRAMVREATNSVMGRGDMRGKFGVGALQMDGGEVTAAADAGLLEGVDDLIAVGGGEVGGEADDVDEPADAEVGNVEGREG